MTTLTLTDSAPASQKGDVLVLGTVSGEPAATLAGGPDLPSGTVKHLTETLAAVGAEGKADEVIKLTGVPGVKASLVLLVGQGKPATGVTRSETLRRTAGAAARALPGTATAVFALGDGSADDAAAVAEGIRLGSYRYAEYFGAAKAPKAKAPLGEAVVLGPKGRSREGKALLSRANAVTDAVAFARDLVNTPPNALFPASFAEQVQQRAGGRKVSVEVWDEKRLEAEGCGGILGVGQGSGRPPRLVKLSYSPSRPQARLAVVGKGITFDSGGLCIKPGASMVTMKCDMAGAAAAAAAVLAVAELGLPVEVTAYLCLAENMTGDLAQRPGDVVTMRGGKTVEIINTDAEGRLVMADGLALATETSPDAIVDIATLTGACVIALGERTMGVMGNDDALRERTVAAAAQSGEPAWPLPIAEELRATMDSPVADIKHTGERAGGAMVAATFLREFVGTNAAGEQIPWAHIDIAGPAFNEKAPFGYTPKGGSGSGVRALVALVESYAG